MIVRPGNHTGPGQDAAYVVPAFVEQLRAIRAGTREPVLAVGNLDSERNFTDVRDVARAYRLLIERGEAGGVYNLGSPANVRIGELLDMLYEIAKVRPEIRVDPDLHRPTDCAPLLDTHRLQATTGWAVSIPLAKTLADMMEAG
jgi:GDP-4-dehydro-6-deoxy-D-mannose reductase